MHFILLNKHNKHCITFDIYGLYLDWKTMRAAGKQNELELILANVKNNKRQLISQFAYFFEVIQIFFF